MMNLIRRLWRIPRTATTNDSVFQWYWGWHPRWTLQFHHSIGPQWCWGAWRLYVGKRSFGFGWDLRWRMP